MPEELELNGTTIVGQVLAGLFLMAMSLFGLRSLPLVQTVASALARWPLSLRVRWSRPASRRSPRGAAGQRSKQGRSPRRAVPRRRLVAIILIRLVVALALLGTLAGGVAVSVPFRGVPAPDLWQVTGRTAVASGPVFQDFRVSEKNLNCVSHFWGDTFHENHIVGRVCAEGENPREDLHYLRCTFRAGVSGAGWPPAVAVRGQSEQALTGIPTYGSIVVQLRVPAEADLPSAAKCYCLRVRDRLGTYWKFVCHKGTCVQFEVPADGQWHTARVSLRDASRWEVFAPDGNAAFAGDHPDFSIITDVVFEIGDRGSDRPTPSAGTMDIGPITLE